MNTSRLGTDFYAGIFLTLLGSVFLFLASELSAEAVIFPRIILVTFVILAIGMTVQGYLNSKRGSGAKLLHLEGLKIPMLMFAFITAYVVVMDFLGFYIATAAFIPGVALFYRNRNPVHLIATVVGMLGFIHLLFVVQLNLVIP